MQIVSEKERKIKMDKKEFALNQHEKWNGKIEVISRAKIETPEDLAAAKSNRKPAGSGYCCLRRFWSR